MSPWFAPEMEHLLVTRSLYRDPDYDTLPSIVTVHLVAC